MGLVIKMAHARRVVVTGLGACCPLGTGVPYIWKRLLDGHCGIGNLPKGGGFDTLPSQVVGLVPTGTEHGQFNEEDWVSRFERRTMSLGSIYALCTAAEAIEDSNWRPRTQDERERTGVAIGSSMADLEEVYKAGVLVGSGKYRRVSPYLVPRILTNMAAGLVSMRFNLHGPNHSVSTACTTGLHAIGDAACMIARGACDVMVAGGTEACVHPIAFAGLCRTKALSTKFNSKPQEASRPFDSKRDGFVLSEGAGVLVLEELDHARQRGAKIYAEILGYGMSGDAYHITAPANDGKGAQMCMRAAVRDAGLPVESVGYVCAHATSTPLGDAAESRAIKNVFGKHSYEMFISAPKGSIGHLLGAAGAIEAIFTVMAVKDGTVSPTLNLTNTEPELDLNYVPNQAAKWRCSERRIALTNSFGFGGTNASLCVGETPA